VLESGRSAAR